ncbi:MAG TPA: hypothetical protein DCX25_02750 [Candidatus Pacebacteria bacterium]|nr:MAG: hypothetical protein UX00_C0004G0026 [Microgenomates group bacterium GW2011_GWB1_45_17]KKU23976.1 MAG: hypothetical protein UX35_C0003G0112 [Microgenomates group bacterium GW2011_GWA1_46_15]KKU24631.1 MAG: hypothetical protein UX36_C0001G0248 [Microgenomates group bacterium GW2011_GWC1_46_15]HAV15224.1 hypothetical protein [Candidatus Paceibacterota bacterium]HCR10939.1 hypothetical protein [Candidatus Paceibacterota bacterium]
MKKLLILACIVLFALLLVIRSNQSTTIPSEGDDAQEITKEKAIALIQKKFPEVKNIKENPNITIGMTMYIRTTQKDNFWKLLFWQGSGDCEAGCLNDHEWYFIVKSDSSVEKVGEFERIFNSRKNGSDEKGMRIANFLE